MSDSAKSADETTRYEYKRVDVNYRVPDESSGILSPAQKRVCDIDEVLNELAEDGWRLVEATHGSSGCWKEILVEREVPV